MSEELERRLRDLLRYDGEVTTTKLIEYGQGIAEAADTLKRYREALESLLGKRDYGMAFGERLRQAEKALGGP